MTKKEIREAVASVTAVPIGEVRRKRRAETPSAGDGGDGPEPDIRPAWCSDDAMADEVSNALGQDWKYETVSGTWRRYLGTHWDHEKSQLVYSIARKVHRKVASECADARLARQVSSKSAIYASVKLAGTARRHAVLPEAFDSDDWFFNTLTATIDLRTAARRPHDRRDMISRIAKGAVEGRNWKEAAPTFATLLRMATGEDVAVKDETAEARETRRKRAVELQRFLQRVAGYCLTGSIEEHAIFFIEGPGGTGKTAFLTAFAEAMGIGNYSAVAPMDIFTIATGERHPADMALLEGVRLVIASETEEGRRWDEAKLKAITGGDPITARRMRQDFFTFKPKFKLFMAGNYRPAMRSADDAMRRRFHVIPFRHKPPAIDKQLPEKLRSERGGILQWAIEGAIYWQQLGLAPPADVVEATDEYFEAENALGRWIEERCLKGPDQTELTKALYRDFKSWAGSTGEYAGSERRFAQRIARAGFARWQHPVSRARGFRGLAIKPREGGGEAPDDIEGTADPGDDYER